MGNFSDCTLYSSDSEISVKLAVGKSIKESVVWTFKNGELIEVKLNEVSYLVEFHSIDGGISRTVKLESSGISSVLYISETLQMQQYLPVLAVSNMLIFDTANTGKLLLETELHQDIQDWLDYYDEDKNMGGNPQVIVFQKQTLVSLFELFLSALIIPMYHELPDILKYLVCEVLSC